MQGWRWLALMLVGVSMTAVAERPKIGVVLSGGGAKGAAHIGVLRTLERNQIPVDYLAGTSMGAYVATLYAVGYSADEIEAIIGSMDFNTGFSDDVPREQRIYRDKAFYDHYPIETKVGFNEGEFTLPKGALQGQTMSSLIRRSLGPVPTVEDFDQLPIPLRTVATDLTDRSAMVFDQGSLAIAMQASMTVPGALAPIQYEDKLLVDGGLVNNLPVDVVKAMGADVVIAVDIGSPLHSRDELNSVIDVLSQLSGYLTNLTRDQQVALMSEKDLLIVPDIGDVGTSDFDKMPLMIQRGEHAAQEMLAQLLPYQVSPAAYQRYQAEKTEKREALFDQAPVITAVDLENASWVDPTVILEALDLPLGTALDSATLEEAISRVYALNQFERVDARIDRHGDEATLVISARNKDWGPNVFDLGLRFEDNFEEELDFGIDVAYSAYNLFDLRTQWRTELNLGTNKRFATELYQPLGRNEMLFSRVGYQYINQRWNVLETEANLIQSLRQSSHDLYAGLGLHLGRAAQVELLYRYEDGELDSIPSGNSSKLAYYHYKGPELLVGYDTLDNGVFPTRGMEWRLSAAYLDSYTRFLPPSGIDGSEHQSLWAYQARWRGAYSLGAHTVSGKVEVESLDQNSLQLSRLTSIGGFLNLSGYYKDALFGNHKGLGTLIYRYDLSNAPFGITLPVSIGASAEAGNIWDSKDDMALDDLIYAGSAFVSTDTRWGPAAFAYGQTDDGNRSIYFFFGKPF
ncbi:patatin-like phospholipase family protein [Ferrimonas marina]|uniref:NTE family protein n=1 Tax=Ferrimonas marina TaxID=299255 RepID=A0A1M5X3M5_9GAMM|nr:patatin-like phospholipase family protein [Ferrimonas marina]SHH94435.1 NTE family protein [Ferrimonas marina]